MEGKEGGKEGREGKRKEMKEGRGRERRREGERENEYNFETVKTDRVEKEKVLSIKLHFCLPLAGVYSSQ